MLKMQDIIFPSDIQKLPKETLKDLCTELDMKKEGTQQDLAINVWPAFESKEVSEEIFSTCRDRVLCGRTGVSWLSLSRNEEYVKLQNIKEKIIESCQPKNPFEGVIDIDKGELSTEPVLVAATEVGNKEYYLRFLRKSGVIQDDLYSYETRVRGEFITVYIDEGKGIIEVRSDHKKAKKVAKSLSLLLKLDENTTIIPVDFISKLEDDEQPNNDEEANESKSIEAKVAEVLGGQLIESIGKPEVTLEEFGQDEANAVIKILAAIDKYISDASQDSLIESIGEALDSFDEELSATPFTALLLSGLSTVGLGTIKDLRGLPLYDYLAPFLSSQNGSIIIKVNDNGIQNEYSVKIGLTSKSVTFNNPATESAIKFIRERVIINC